MLRESRLRESLFHDIDSFRVLRKSQLHTDVTVTSDESSWLVCVLKKSEHTMTSHDSQRGTMSLLSELKHWNPAEARINRYRPTYGAVRQPEAWPIASSRAKFLRVLSCGARECKQTNEHLWGISSDQMRDKLHLKAAHHHQHTAASSWNRRAVSVWRTREQKSVQPETTLCI